MTATSQPSLEGPTFCAVHPAVETSLRCNKCGRYMCSKCAVKVPVGYRCRQCVYEHQNVFFNVQRLDYAVAAAISLVLAVPAAYVLSRLGLFLVIILGLPAGGLISEAVHRAIGQRRGRYIWLAAVIGIAAGTLIASLPELQTFLALAQAASSSGSESGDILGGLLGALLPNLLFVVMSASAAAARLRFGK
jgi:hypothetical protein